MTLTCLGKLALGQPLRAVAKKRDVTYSWIACELMKETSTLRGIWTQ
jgi:hypothetical protein